LSIGIARSLHIRLFAPIDWKVKAMRERNNISTLDAQKVVAQIDKQRSAFRDSFIEKDQPDFTYDIEFNCARLSQEEIIDITIKLAENRSLFS